MGTKNNRPGGSPGLFATTHWSVVLRAVDHDHESLARLCESYREPLVTYLRCLGTEPEQALDMVQGFLGFLLEHDSLSSVDRQKGRFRTFLITSLKHYVSDQRDRAAAQKRGGGQPPVSLNGANDPLHPALQVADANPAPDTAFDRAWAQTVFGSAVARLRQECADAGRAGLFEAVEPLMYQDGDAPGYRDAAQPLGMTEGALRVAAKRLRDRLRHLVREEVRQTVANEEDWEAELRYLVQLFGR